MTENDIQSLLENPLVDAETKKLAALALSLIRDRKEQLAMLGIYTPQVW